MEFYRQIFVGLLIGLPVGILACVFIHLLRHPK